MLDCFLDLNAIPDWIENDDTYGKEIKRITNEKIIIMRGFNFFIDENKLDYDIDHQLRLIRLVSNHAKHRKKTDIIPIIKYYDGAALPMPLDAPLFHVGFGANGVNAVSLVIRVSDFWKKLLSP